MDSNGKMSDAAKFQPPSGGSHGNEQGPAAGASTAEATEEENIQPSSIQYYMENKYPKSYQIKHDLRGHGIVFVMATERKGWEHDLSSLKRLFKALNVTVHDGDWVKDPTKQDIQEKLLSFCTRDCHGSSDYAFIVFMGHGRGPHAVEIKTSDGQMVDVYKQCALSCTHPDSKLTQKPKTIIVQACREDQGEEANSAYLTKQQYGQFHHYIFAYACQPGTPAARNPSMGSHFITCLVDTLKKDSHNNTLTSMLFKITKQVEERTKSLVGESESSVLQAPQKPQSWTGASHNFNYFPDFVHTWGPSVGLTETSIEILISNDLTSKETLMEVSDGDIDALGLVPGQKIKLKQGIRSLLTASEQTERSANANYMVTLHTSVATDHCGTQTEIHLFQDVCDQKQKLQERLSRETNRNVEIETIEQGSIVLKILLPDKETKNYVKLLVETGKFDEILQEMFITDQFKSKCGVNSVNLQTEVTGQSEEVKYVEYHIADQYAFAGEEVQIQSKIPALSQKWYKDVDPAVSMEDEAALESNDHLHISGDNEPPGLHITKAKEADSGRYWCIAQTEGKPVKLLCFVYITDTSKTSDVAILSAIVNLQASVIAKYTKGAVVKNSLHEEITSITDILEFTNISKQNKKYVVPSKHITVDAGVVDPGLLYSESVGDKAGDKGEDNSVEAMEDEAVTVKDEELPSKYQYAAFYDAAFIHSGDPSDVEVADTLCEEIEKEVTLKNGEKPRLYLKERDKHLGRSRLNESGNAVSNSTYKFVILSPKLTEDKWSNMLKDETIMTAIENEDLQWSVIPIHTGKKGDYAIPFGLRALNAIELTSKGQFFYRNLANVFDKKLYVREDREKKFFEEKEKIPKDIRPRKEKEIRDRKHEELMEQRKMECEGKNEFAAYKKDEREVEQYLRQLQPARLDTTKIWSQQPPYKPPPYTPPSLYHPPSPETGTAPHTVYKGNVDVLQHGQFNTAYTGQSASTCTSQMPNKDIQVIEAEVITETRTTSVPKDEIEKKQPIESIDAPIQVDTNKPSL